jgi:hypothetical protein
MNITKKIHVQGKSLLRLLRSTPENLAPALSDGQRPPATIYALSLTRTLRRLDEVLDCLKAYTLSAQLDVHDGADQNLATATEELLTQIARHGEDCRQIVAAYFGSEADTSRRFAAGIKSLTDSPALIASRIGAHGGRVRLISFMGNSVIVSGFFIEGPDAQGRPGPCPVVHGGQDTAFSYAMYLRKVLVELVSVNSRVYEAVAGAGIRENKAITASENPDMIRLAKRIADLPAYVFPDEARGSLPAITLKRDPQGESATVAATSLKKPLLPPVRCTISVSAEAEKIGEGYRVPYA